jgi:O-antigen/teichoic acid export membrane protein
MLTGLIAAYATASLVRPVSVAWLIAATLNVGLNFLLIPTYEISGAAAATALALGGGAIYLALVLNQIPLSKDD